MYSKSSPHLVNMSSHDLHIFFLPFLAPGHMIPMVDLARVFASRTGVKATIVTTTGNASLIQPTLDCSPHNIQLLTLPFPSSVQNNTGLPTPAVTPDFVRALDSLEHPFRYLVDQHRPDFIVSDAYYPWTADLGITRLIFHGSSAFCSVVAGATAVLKLHERVSDDDEPFVVPGMPHEIVMTRSKLMEAVTRPDELIIRMSQSFRRSYGMIMNTVAELEPDYVGMMKVNSKAWPVGPVSLCHQDGLNKAVRGGTPGENFKQILNWLDGKKPGSVLYVCFGSLGRFSCSQLREMAVGLEDSGHPFIWVVRNRDDDKAGWMPNERSGKGLIVTGWVPQILILNHGAVGGFMTHCGWNSCLEGASAGLPMITWPLFAEQFFNEKLLVSVLRVGVSVGSKVCSNDEEKRTLVKAEEVKKAVDEVMGSGEEAEERRKRAQEYAVVAKKAVEEGGSSFEEMSRLIQELKDVKAGKVEIEGEQTQ